MSKKHPKIPIGIDDFEEICTHDYCYVDKSQFIDEVVNGSFKVALMARPRRFGKTLNLSILRYFFDLDYKKPSGTGDKHLFEGLDIAKNEDLCNIHMNKYPVFLSL